MISYIIIENISFDNLTLEDNYKLYSLKNIEIYKNNKIFSNSIAFIGDDFTFNSLNNIVNLKYISKNDIDTVDVNLYDF